MASCAFQHLTQSRPWRNLAFSSLVHCTACMRQAGFTWPQSRFAKRACVETVFYDVCSITPQGARMFTGDSNAQNGAQVVWGSLRNMGLGASVATSVADFPGAPDFLTTRYGCLAASQLNYILGDTGARVSL